MAGRYMRLICAVVVLAISAPAGAGTRRSGWEQLNLSRTTIDGTTIYYEEALEPNLPIFAREITAFLAEREKVAAVLARSSEIVADINRILGASDLDVIRQERFLTDMRGLFIKPKLTFRLVSTPTVKAYLRDGGQLPDFSYDARTDTMQYQPRIAVEPGVGPPENCDLFIAGEPDDAFVKQLSRTFSGRSALYVGVRMATETALMQRARTAGAHWRWFIDGFASAITERVIDKYMGTEAAMEFEAASNPYQYRDLEDQVNLRYWLVGTCSPYVSEIPVESESRILHARSAYAMFEAKRLIDANGIGCIRAMLDMIAARSLQSRSDLVAVIKEVTGQDMEPRLDRYQTFKTEEEGLAVYTKGFDVASKSDDHERMFVNAMRMIELQGDHPSLPHLRNFFRAAFALWKMDHGQAADHAVQIAVDMYSSLNVPGGRRFVLEAFANYCLATDRPQKAEKSVEELLRLAPDNLAGLSVRMHVSRQDGRVVEATEFARQIQRLAKPESPFYRDAAELLSFDPNQPSAPSQEKRWGWGALNLVKTTIAGTTVYYEKALEPNLPAFERELSKYAAGRDRVSAFIAKRDEIIADINRILGVTEPNLGEQERLFSSVSGSFSQTKLTLYLAKVTTVKDFLRGGGELPALSYDRATNTASHNPRLRVPPGGKPPTWEVWIPIMPDKGLADSLGMLSGLGQFFGSFAGEAAIHEVTELALVLRAKPTDPYWRWFSDGFANAVTAVLIEKHLGTQAADEFVQDYDLSQYRDLEKEINLRYWMMATYFPYGAKAPVETEQRIVLARYAYSFFEAKRLIDANGIDCVRKILDRITASQSRKTDDLLEVIKEVTGQDIGPRLAGYQTFETTEQGISKYTGAFQAAQQGNDWEQMIVSVLRIMELRGDVYSGNYLQSFGNIALFLFKMGKEEAGDAVMRRAIDLFARSPIEHGREAAMELFLLYALQCQHPGKAETEADELLQLNPEASLPLAIKMLVTLQHGNVTNAQALARQIQSRGNEQSVTYKLAANVLAMDPNHPVVPKEPASTQTEPTKKTAVTE